MFRLSVRYVNLFYAIMSLNVKSSIFVRFFTHIWGLKCDNDIFFFHFDPVLPNLTHLACDLRGSVFSHVHTPVHEHFTRTGKYIPKSCKIYRSELQNICIYPVH